MNKFEYLVNNGKFANRTICTTVINVETGETFTADINANTLSEIDSKLPSGFEMDKITTLQNYFEPNTCTEYELEIENSQFIYFADFENEVYQNGFYEYIETLENDNSKKQNEMDRRYR